MTVEAERFPKVEAGDAEDVVLALETGRALWGQGDPREAVRWLRRAAEHAEESGNDMRALTLARAAADLTTVLQVPAALTTPAPPDEYGDKTLVDNASQSNLRSAAPKLPTPPTRPTQSRKPPPPSATASVSPRPPSVAPAPGHNGAAKMASVAPVPERPSRPSARPSVPPSRPNAAPRPQATTAQSPVVKLPSAKPRAALRVAVTRTASGGPGALVVRILEEGQELPEGAVEALLVPLDPSTDLLGLR